MVDTCELIIINYYNYLFTINNGKEWLITVLPGDVQMLHPQMSQRVGVFLRESNGDKNSMDWSKGKITGNTHTSWENLWFPLGFPLSQSIEGCVERMLKNKYLKWTNLETWMDITPKCALDRNW